MFLAGCGGAPPFPTGAPCSGEAAPPWTLQSAPEGARAAPVSAEDVAALGRRWWQEPRSASRDWALGRLSLLGCPARPEEASALLEAAAGSEPCLAAGDRRAAALLGGAPWEALELSVCGDADVPHEQVREQVLSRLRGPDRSDGVDPRTLLRQGPAALLAWLEEPNNANASTLRQLWDEGGGARRPPESAPWWLDPAPEGGDVAWLEALRALIGVQLEIPPDAGAAERIAADLEALAKTFGPAASGLPRCRALHLRAWTLDVGQSPAQIEAWMAAGGACAASPWLQAEAALLAAQNAWQAEQARFPIDAQVAAARRVAEEYSLGDTRTQIARFSWRRRRRPSLSAREADALLALMAGEEGPSSADYRLPVLGDLSWAAQRAGRVALAALAIEAGTRLEEEAGLPCMSHTFRAADAQVQPTLRQQIAATRVAEERASVCNAPGHAFFARLYRVELLFRAGAVSEARSDLDEARRMASELGPRYRLAAEAASIDEPGQDRAALARFEAAMGERAAGGREESGWGMEATSAAVQAALGRGAPASELLELYVRRESLRWSGAARSVPPPSVPLLGMSERQDGGGFDLAFSPSSAPLRWTLDEPAPMALDRASFEGSTWALGGVAPPAGSSLAELGAIVEGAGLSGSRGPLVGLGTGTEVLPPLALLAVGGQPLGRLRPTAEWIPTPQTPPSCGPRSRPSPARAAPRIPGSSGSRRSLSGRRTVGSRSCRTRPSCRRSRGPTCSTCRPTAA